MQQPRVMILSPVRPSPRPYSTEYDSESRRFGATVIGTMTTQESRAQNTTHVRGMLDATTRMMLRVT